MSGGWVRYFSEVSGGCSVVVAGGGRVRWGEWYAFGGFRLTFLDFFFFLGSLGEGGEGNKNRRPLSVQDVVDNVVHVPRSSGAVVFRVESLGGFDKIAGSEHLVAALNLGGGDLSRAASLWDQDPNLPQPLRGRESPVVCFRPPDPRMGDPP